jgi:filamentous hemagglutinin family protein
VAAPVRAQITFDGTVGPPGALSGPDYLIEAKNGTQVGGNLFHSFGDFNVAAGESATFTGPASVDNIVGRVTGGRPSFVDGLVRSEIVGADLFLVNPSGMIFGPDASLDVQGSFTASTADYVRLGENGRFDASEPSASIIDVAPPSAFGFLGSDPAGIRVEGSRLAVPEGETLALAGGDLALTDARLSAPRGTIDLASAAAEGELVRDGWDARSDTVQRFGAIDLRNPSASGAESAEGVPNLDASGAGGGRIFIRGGRLVTEGAAINADTAGEADGARVGIRVTDELDMSGGGVMVRTFAGGSAEGLEIEAGDLTLRDGAQLHTSTFGKGDGADAVLSASTISFSGEAAATNDEGELRVSGVFARTAAEGDTGNVTLAADEVLFGDGAKISITTRGVGEQAGDAGDLTIRAREVSLSGESSDGFTSALFADTEADGDAGTIFIETESLSLTSGAQIGVSSTGGRGGSLSLTADSVLIDGGSLTRELPSGIASVAFGSGQAGDLALRVGTLTVSNGGAVSVTTVDTGKGGDIDIVAEKSITLSGVDPQGEFSSGLFAAVVGSGDGGTISVTTPLLTMDRGTIDAGISRSGTGKGGEIVVDVGQLSMTNGASIFTTSSGAGDANRMRVSVRDLADIRGAGSGLFSRAESTGDGGDIRVDAGRVVLDDGASIGAESSGETIGAGDAGSVEVTVGDSLQMRRSSITTAAAQAFGGSVEIRAGSLVDLDRSAIITSVGSGAGDGGNVTAHAPFFILDQSQVIARADVGNGGNIDIEADTFLASPDSVVNASSNRGIDGEVRISSPEVDLTGALAVLPETFLRADELLPQACAAGAGGLYSSFVVRGPEGVPESPGGFTAPAIIPLPGCP